MASQHKEELRFLLQQVKDVHIKVVLEIGVHRGHSLLVWEQAFKPKILIGIDHVDHIEPPHLKEKLIPGDSGALSTVQAVAKALNGWKVDFLFIDGDHRLPQVEKDWDIYHHLVRKGGVVAFHDVGVVDDPNVQVYKLWKKLVKKYPNSELNFPGGTGIGILFL